MMIRREVRKETIYFSA